MLAGVLFHPDLSIADLTDAEVTLRLRHMETSGVVTLPAIVVDDPRQGQVQHVWRRGETDVSGAYFFHWIARWGDFIETFPNDGRGRILNIVAPYPRYAGVPRADHILCGDISAQGSTCADLHVDLKTEPGQLRGRLRGQGSTELVGGLSRPRRGMIGRGTSEAELTVEFSL